MNRFSRNSYFKTSLTFFLMAALCLTILPSMNRNAVLADHTFTVSAGIYRIPYIDGNAVSANNDHHNHPNVPNRVDLGGGDGALGAGVRSASEVYRRCGCEPQCGRCKPFIKSMMAEASAEETASVLIPA